MVDKPSLTSAHLVAPLIGTKNFLSSKCYNIFRPHARCREARNCTSKRKETEKSRSKIRCKFFHNLSYKLTLHERCTKCEAHGCGPLFKCSVAKQLKGCKNRNSLTGKEISLDLFRVFFRFDNSIRKERSASFVDFERSECKRGTRCDSGGSDWLVRS